MTARLIIGAPASGSGKTTLAAGLTRALRRRGLVIQPFKCGPDYIDPGYHALAAGRPCRNLDTWLLPPQQVRALFAWANLGADLALVEGVMGLFDGLSAHDEAGSTADLARLLDAPVVLAIDARGMARSAAALVGGFARFDPRVRVAGVLLNRVGGERHARLCAEAIREHTGLPCLGFLPRHDELRLPERHLGLITTSEPGPWEAVIELVADALEQSCDLDAILALARSAPPLDIPAAPEARPLAGVQPLIAVARDAAFSFLYPETAELLEGAGARIAYFSPLADQSLPEGTAGLLLAGGFPEVYAAQLSANSSMRAAIRGAHERAIPIVAECGGLMYLTEELVDPQGARWPMVGLLPGRSVMAERVVLGYRRARAAGEGPLLPSGATIRGHEFHYSRWEGRPQDFPPAYTFESPESLAGTPEGALVGATLASYLHLHWLARPEMAERFVRRCAGSL
jgi:cobyrinic acid a,c-diamide synthase